MYSVFTSSELRLFLFFARRPRHALAPSTFNQFFRLVQRSLEVFEVSAQTALVGQGILVNDEALALEEPAAEHHYVVLQVCEPHVHLILQTLGHGRGKQSDRHYCCMGLILHFHRDLDAAGARVK